MPAPISPSCAAAGYPAPATCRWRLPSFLPPWSACHGAPQTKLNPLKHSGISDFGLAIVERVPLSVPPNRENELYLRTKRERLGHLIDDQPSTA